MTFKTWFTHKQQKWSLLWWLSSHFPQWNKVGKADSEVPFQKCLGINYSHHILHFPFLLSKTTTLDLLFWSPHSDKLLNFILFLILPEKAAIKNATSSYTEHSQSKDSTFFLIKRLFTSFGQLPKNQNKTPTLTMICLCGWGIENTSMKKVTWNINKMNLLADLFILKCREKPMAQCLSQPAVKLFFVTCQCTEFWG